MLATETSAYAKRYDMIAVCTGDRVLLPKIFTPKERAGAEVRGINRSMLLQFIDDVLAQAVEGLDRYPLTLVLDRATIHMDVDAIRQAFHDRGSESIKDILLMPPNAAKRLSPLDNALFHDWKEACRLHCPATAKTIVRIMSDAWEKMKPGPHYLHCGLTRNKDPYFDCPATCRAQARQLSVGLYRSIQPSLSSATSCSRRNCSHSVSTITIQCLNVHDKPTDEHKPACNSLARLRS